MFPSNPSRWTLRRRFVAAANQQLAANGIFPRRRVGIEPQVDAAHHVNNRELNPEADIADRDVLSEQDVVSSPNMSSDSNMSDYDSPEALDEEEGDRQTYPSGNIDMFWRNVYTRIPVMAQYRMLYTSIRIFSFRGRWTMCVIII